MEPEQKIDEICQDCSSKMKKTIESLKKEFAKVQTGKANPSILDNVRVDYYGTATPINQLGNIGLADQLITITAWEKNMLPEIERAILKANIGLVPQNDGNLIRIPFQALTEERRKELVKMVNKITEDYRTSLRNLRREAKHVIKDLEKQKLLSDDFVIVANDEVQKLTDKFIQSVDELNKAKEKELLSD